MTDEHRYVGMIADKEFGDLPRPVLDELVGEVMHGDPPSVAGLADRLTLHPRNLRRVFGRVDPWWPMTPSEAIRYLRAARYAYWRNRPQKPSKLEAARLAGWASARSADEAHQATHGYPAP